MPWYGKQLQNRDAVDYIEPHWPNQKVKALCTFRAESRLFVGAIREYPNGDADLGFCQHNVKAAQMAALKPKLWTDSKDETVWKPVLKENIRLAYEKWNSPWYRHGRLGKRLWQPWAAYTSGWATFPEAWVWRHTYDEDGELTVPVGPWVPTGRYVHQAIQGVSNWWHFNKNELDEREALAEAERLASQYAITKGDLAYTPNKGVYWIYPPQPTSPPADGIGPRPKPNNGQ